jgi:hypothetical protein
MTVINLSAPMLPSQHVLKGEILMASRAWWTWNADQFFSQSCPSFFYLGD